MPKAQIPGFLNCGGGETVAGHDIGTENDQTFAAEQTTSLVPQPHVIAEIVAEGSNMWYMAPENTTPSKNLAEETFTAHKRSSDSSMQMSQL